MVRLAFVRRVSRLGFATEWLKRGSSTAVPKQECPPWCPTTTKEVVMKVMIGIDPHKASHTAVAIDGAEDADLERQGAGDQSPGGPTHRLG